MSEIVGMRLPVQLHFREGGALEDLLHFGHRVANFELLGFRDVRILLLVEVLNAASNALHRRVCSLVIGGQNRDCFLLDEGQGSIDAAREQATGRPKGPATHRCAWDDCGSRRNPCDAREPSADLIFLRVESFA